MFVEDNFDEEKDVPCKIFVYKTESFIFFIFKLRNKRNLLKISKKNLKIIKNILSTLIFRKKIGLFLLFFQEFSLKLRINVNIEISKDNFIKNKTFRTKSQFF